MLLTLCTSGLRRLRLWSWCMLCFTPGPWPQNCPQYRCAVCTCVAVHRQLNTFFGEKPGWNWSSKGAVPRESIGSWAFLSWLGLETRLAPWLLVGRQVCKPQSPLDGMLWKSSRALKSHCPAGSLSSSFHGVFWLYSFMQVWKEESHWSPALPEQILHSCLETWFAPGDVIGSKKCLQTHPSLPVSRFMQQGYEDGWFSLPLLWWMSGRDKFFSVSFEDPWDFFNKCPNQLKSIWSC